MVSSKSVLGVLAILAPFMAFAQQTAPVAEVNVEVVSNTRQAPAAEVRVSLDELVREAVDKNPGIQSAARRVESLRRRVPQVKTLPDPTVSVGWMGNIAPFTVQKGDPSSFRSIGATQEIP
jgi:outer membrane protein TolC